MIADIEEYTELSTFKDVGVLTADTFSDWRKKSNGIIQALSLIADNSVGATDIDVNLTTSLISLKDGGVTVGKLATNSVSTIKIVDGAITDTKLASNSVTTAKVLNGNITNAKLANMDSALIKGRQSGAIAGVPQDLTATQVRTILNVEDGANNYVHPAHTGEVTGSGALTIINNAVTNAKLADMAGATIKGRAVGASGDPQDLSAALARTILNVEDGANNYSHPSHTGEVTGSGALTITAGAVTAAKLATNSVTTIKIVDGNITTDKLAAQAVSTSKIENNAVTEFKIADLSISTDKIKPDAVTSNKIGAEQVKNSHISLNSIGGNRIIDGTITSTQLANFSVSNMKIAPLAVTSDKIAIYNINASHLTGYVALGDDNAEFPIYGVRAWGKIAVGGGVTKNCGIIGEHGTYGNASYTGKIRVGGVPGGAVCTGLYKVAFTTDLPHANYIVNVTPLKPDLDPGDSWLAPTNAANSWSGRGDISACVVAQTSRYFIVKTVHTTGEGSGYSQDSAFFFTITF